MYLMTISEVLKLKKTMVFKNIYFLANSKLISINSNQFMTSLINNTNNQDYL